MNSEGAPCRSPKRSSGVGSRPTRWGSNSPARHLRPGLPPLVVARGSNETVAFADEHDELVSTAGRLGASVVDLVVPARNHFDLPLGLGDPGDPLGRAVFGQMRLGTRTRRSGVR